MSDFPETKAWRVEDVREGKVETVKGRSLQRYYVDFAGAPDTYWRRNAGDLPEIGKEYQGTISENEYGLLFKYEPPKGAGGGRSGGGGNGKMRERPATEIAGARHAHNLLVASENLERLPAEPTPGEVDNRVTVLNHFAGTLDQQTAKISAEAASGAEVQKGDTSAPSSRAAVEQNNDRERGEVLERALESRGVNSASVPLIVTYALGNMTAVEVSAAIERLQSDAMAKGAVARLTERTESHLGEPLPEAVPEDDIPF